MKQRLFLTAVAMILGVLSRETAFAQASRTASPARPAASAPTSRPQRNVTLSEETLALIEEKGDEFRRSLEERTRKLLDKEFLEGRALVVISLKVDLEKVRRAVANDSSIALSTLPSSVSAGKMERLFVENMPVAAFKGYLEKLNVMVTVDAAVSDAQLALIEKMLRGGLNLPSIATFEVQKADLASSSAAKTLTSAKEDQQRAERERQRAADEASRASREKEVISREKESIASDKRAADLALRQEQQKSQLLTQENETLKTKIRTLEEDLNIYKTPLGDVKKLIKGLELPLTILPVAVLVMGVMILLGAISNSTGRKKAAMMKEGVELISAALGKLGSKMPRPGEAITVGQGRAEERESLALPTGNSQMSGSALMAEESHAIKRDAEAAWTESWSYSFLVLCELREWLASGTEGRLRFLSLVSALPPADASQVMGSFSPAEMRELKDVVVDVNSKMLGYSLILSLHRAVLGALASMPPLVAKITGSNLIKAADAMLARTLSQFSVQEQAAVLGLLPSSRWARVLELSGESQSPETLARILDGMAGSEQPEESAQKEILSRVEANLESALAVEKASRGTMIMDEIVQGMNGFGPRLKGALQAAQKENLPFAGELKQRTVTFENVLWLDSETLRELLDPLDTEQVAQIALALDTQGQRALLAGVNSRMRASLQADVQRLSATPPLRRRASAMGRQLQAELVSRLREMAEQGLVEIPRGPAPQLSSGAPEVKRSA